VLSPILYGYSYEKGVFESCETEYYSVHKVKFIPSEKYQSHSQFHSLIRERLHKSIEDSFKRGHFESCGLMGCSIDFIFKK